MRFVMPCLLGTLLVLLVVACTPAPTPVTPPSPDASDASPGPAPPTPAPSTACAAACAALKAAGCPEATPADCAATLQHVNDDRLVRTPGGPPLTCAALAGVTTVAQARAAGIACGSP